MTDEYVPKPLTESEQAVLVRLRERLERHSDDSVAVLMTSAERNALQRMSEVTLYRMAHDAEYSRIVGLGLLEAIDSLGLDDEQKAALRREVGGK